MDDGNEGTWEGSAIRRELLTAEHPRLAGLPDLGLLLSDEDEAELRARATAHGLDFDRLRQDFELSHQVLPPRARGKLRSELVRKRIVPVNALKDYVNGMIGGAIFAKHLRSDQKPPK